MVNIEAVFYQFAKFQKFPASGSMGSHRLKSGKETERQRIQYVLGQTFE